MSVSTTIYSEKEINKMIDEKISKIRTEFYKELNKLREQLVDMNDIAKVLSRK